MLDGYGEGAGDYDDHCYAVQELDNPNESGEYLLSEDLLDGYADPDEPCDAVEDLNNSTGDEYLLCGDLLEGHADFDEHCYDVQDLNDPYESDEHLLCDDLLEGCTDCNDNCYAAQDLDSSNEGDEYLSCGDLLEGYANYDEHGYEVQELNDPYENDEHLLCGDSEGSVDYDEYWHPVQDNPDLNDEQYFLEEFGGFANNNEYWYAAQSQQNPNEPEEILCQLLMEGLNVADRYPPQMPAMTRSTAPKKPAVRIDPPTTGRSSTRTRDNEASGSQTEAGAVSLNAEEDESVRTAREEIIVIENPAASAAERLSIKDGDAADAEKLILQPD